MAAQDVDYFLVDAHFRGKNNVDMVINPARANQTQAVLAQRFFADKFLGFTGKANAAGIQAHGFWVLCYVGSANYLMHRTSRVAEVNIQDLSGDYIMFNDSGLNTLGLPKHLESTQSSVNYIEFTVAILQPWFDTVSTVDIEFWSNNAPVITMQLDLASFIPNYDFGDTLDEFSPALDITKAKAYKILLTPDLNMSALTNRYYDLRYKLGDSSGYKQFLKTVPFYLSAPVSSLNVYNRPSGSCQTTGQIRQVLFNEIKRIRIVPGQELPPRVWFVEPDGAWAWQADDPNDDATIFYLDTVEMNRANGYFFGRWGNFIVTLTNGLITNRLFCQPPTPALPPRDIGRFSVIIDSVVRNGNTATVTYTVVRSLADGGDPGEVGIKVILSDGVGTTQSASVMYENATTVQTIVDHQIRNSNFTGVSGTVVELTWFIS